MPERLEALELMARHEAMVGALYRVFAELFPARAQLWLKLAEEEDGHAETVRALTQLNSEDIAAPYFRFKAQPILISLQYVEEQIELARSGTFTLIKALELTKELEEALLESHALKTWHEAPVSVRGILKDLAEECQRHRDIAVAALAEERAR